MADIFEAFMSWLSQLQQNLIDTFSQLRVEKYIQLVVIIGAYALLRPYILKLAGKQQTKEHEKEVNPEEMASAEGSKPLRDQVQVHDDSDEEEQDTVADWGKKARKRQRQIVRKILEADEKLQREKEGDDEYKDIEEFLVR